MNAVTLADRDGQGWSGAAGSSRRWCDPMDAGEGAGRALARAAAAAALSFHAEKIYDRWGPPIDEREREKRG